MSFRKITLVFAMTVASILTAVESVCSPVQTIEDFIVALKVGKREAALGFYTPYDEAAKLHVGKWLDKALPLFSSSKVETKAENVCFIDGDVAISPIRQWHPGNPDRYEIEMACLVFINGKWLLLPDFEKFNAGANAGLVPDERFRRFEHIWHLFCEFKRFQKDKVRKAHEKQTLRQMDQGE